MTSLGIKRSLGPLAMALAIASSTIPVWADETNGADESNIAALIDEIEIVAASPDSVQADMVVPVAADVPVAQPPIEVTGKGQMVSRRFPLQEGLVTYHAVHTGKSNFIVSIIDGTTGAEVTNIVNEIGAVDAMKSVNLRRTGSYSLQVQADGDWTVTFEEPRPFEAPLVPQSYAGTGTSITPFFRAPGGLLLIGGSYNGSGRVAIRVRDVNGVVVEQVANQVGNFFGSKGVSVPPGIYYLELYGEGVWNVSVE